MAIEWLALLKSGIGYPFKWITKRLEHPEIDIEVKFNNSLRGSQGPADMSQFSADLECMVLAEQLTQGWEISWNYTVDITNNSEYTATNLLLIVPDYELYNLSIQPPISHTKPMKPGETKTHTLIYKQRFLGTYLEADAIVAKFPFEMIELRYKNPTKIINYYTRYRHAEKIENRNQHGTIMKKDAS